MNLSAFIAIAISTIFINNFILSRFLGLCPFIGVSKRTGPAISMGLAVTFVTTTASILTWLIYDLVLIPFHLEYLRTISFILVIAFFVQFAEIVIQKNMPAIYKAFGIYLTLITTNCAVLGVAVLNTDMFFMKGKAVAGSFLLSVFQGFGAGVGFTLAMVLMSGIRERLEFAEIPACLKDAPITFIVASLMSLAFLGFSGFKI
ncbi:MAG: RnfABCDGE type electron transport complex subunit A [Candidatus Omnitrophica bacterium]|nr:RnfABCDGE type electron transport complex subunit A [Candidatus Omnitrophota bacterium]MCM8791223.1 RnfABCDGE type electron transport complex subunit A [Candidatus Omnitrophota bacterium]